ncbi:MAG: LamG-like jellyroll fold domain-containing protein [Candidatus Magasanikiibacteriota bacterium]
MTNKFKLFVTIAMALVVVPLSVSANVVGEINSSSSGAERVYIDDSGGLEAVNSIGDILSGFPVRITGQVFVLEPLLADVNGDGTDEIVVLSRDNGSSYYLYVYDGAGSVLATSILEGSILSSPVVMPLAGQAKDDFLLTNATGEVYQYSYDNNILYSAQLFDKGVPVVVTANKYGNQIFVVTPGQNNIEVYTKSGNVCIKSKTFNTPNILNFPVLDDNNGQLYFTDISNNLWAISSVNGSVVTGFPLVISGTVISAPYLTDINTSVAGDEIVLQLNNGQRVVVDNNGIILTNDIKKKSFLDFNNDSSQTAGLYSALNTGNFTFNNVLGLQKKTTVYSKIKLDPVEANGNVVLPGVVQGLKTTSGRGKITVSWNEYVSLGAGYFNLYRATNTLVSALELAPLTTINVSSTSYEDVEVVLDTDYYYAIVVVDDKGVPGLATDWVGPTQAIQGITNNLIFSFQELDSDNGFTDSVSGLVLRCGVTGCPDVGATGMVDRAVQFDGINDYTYLDNSEFTAPTDQLTIEAWIKPESNVYSTTTIYQTVVAKGLNFELLISDAGLLHAGVRNQNNVRVGLDVANTVRMSEWNYVAMTYDGVSIKAYVNGVKVGERAQTGLISQTTENLSVGMLNGRMNAFQGILDEVKIYKQALSVEELKANYDSLIFTPPVNNTTDLHFTFSEATSANTFADETRVIFAQCPNGYCPVSGVTGINGTALQFDGQNDYLLLYDSQYTKPADKLTLEAWIKPEPNFSSANSLYQSIISKSTIFELDITDVGAIRAGITNIDGTRVAFDTQNSIKMSQWNHVAMTYDGNMIRVYANGVKVGEKAQTGLIKNLDYLTYVGKLGNVYSYQGLMDEVKIHTQTLSDAEISAEYNKYPQTYPSPEYLQFSFSEDINSSMFADLSQTKFVQCSGTTCPISGSEGISGNAITFDGVDDVTALYDSQYTKPADELTLEAWIKPESNNNSASSYQAVVAKGLDYDLFISDAGLLNFSIKNQNNERVALLVPNAVKMGEWNHVVLTYDGSLIKAYANGVKVGEKVQTGLVSDSNISVNIGNYNKISAFQGVIDEVKIYMRTLPDQEVQTNYNTVKPVIIFNGSLEILSDISFFGNTFVPGVQQVKIGSFIAKAINENANLKELTLGLVGEFTGIDSLEIKANNSTVANSTWTDNPTVIGNIDYVIGQGNTLFEIFGNITNPVQGSVLQLALQLVKAIGVSSANNYDIQGTPLNLQVNNVENIPQSVPQPVSIETNPVVDTTTSIPIVDIDFTPTDGQADSIVTSTIIIDTTSTTESGTEALDNFIINLPTSTTPEVILVEPEVTIPTSEESSTIILPTSTTMETGVLITN